MLLLLFQIDFSDLVVDIIELCPLRFLVLCVETYERFESVDPGLQQVDGLLVLKRGDPVFNESLLKELDCLGDHFPKFGFEGEDVVVSNRHLIKWILLESASTQSTTSTTNLNVQ